MSLHRQGFRIEALKCFVTSTLQRFIAVVICGGWLLFACPLLAQPYAAVDTTAARSVSGQFIISASPQYSLLLNRREVMANTNLIRLEPALLAVAAERFKALVWQQLDLKPGPTWQGRIFLVTRPAQSLDDGVVIASGPIFQAWDYRVTLPDVVTRQRYARALAAVLLLEIANRNVPANAHSAEIPAWLADGFAQAALDEDVTKVILSAPTKTEPVTLFTPAPTGDNVLIGRIDEKQRGLDPLSSARATLHKASALTFDQMSWPNDAQVNGNDGGVYLASAQLFVHELLGLKAGQQKMRTFLAQLPQCLNWQKAFFLAFGDDFQRPLDVEKWWTLRTIDFSNHNFGAQWTLADSNEELADLLSVSVEIRDRSNSLPTHAEISWQAAIRNFPPRQRDAVLWAKLRNLELAQFRMATPLAVLTAGYRAALEEYLGPRKPALPAAAPTAPASSPSKITGSKHGSGGGIVKPSGDYNAQIAALMKKAIQNQPPAAPRKVVVTTQTAGSAPSQPLAATQPAKPIQPVKPAEKKPDYAPAPSMASRRSMPMLKRASARETLAKLDELDGQRRELMARLNLSDSPKNMASAAP
ncbi:MAG TPA: hypothetical protein VGO57_13105 [Verrucomicrobiae bacterium]|jgi:hypothetical protein